VNTMPQYFADHLQAGNHSPGLFLIRATATVTQVVAFLVLALASGPLSWRDRIEFIP
jgi:hypothetical protein